MTDGRCWKFVVLVGGLFAAGVSLAAPVASGQEGCHPVSKPAQAGASVPAPAAGQKSSAPAAPSGMMIYIDPQTGALLKEPAPGTFPMQLSPQLQNAFSTSHQGLVETPSAVPGGGVTLDLQGRFQNPLVVTIGADGKPKIRHPYEVSAPCRGK